MMTRPIRLVLLALLMVPVVAATLSSCTELSPEAKKATHHERGMAYLDKAQYREAIIEFKNVVQIDPKDAEGHYRLALAFLKIGSFPDMQAAFGELRKSVEIDPANRDAQVKLAELYLLAREPKKAREHAEVVLAAAPRDTEGLILRGRSLIGEEEFEQGIAELKKALELDPKNIRIHLDLARTYLQMKNASAAEATLRQALQVEPASTDVQLALGDLRILTGRPDLAEAEYKRAVEMAPDNNLLYMKLGGFYQLLHKWAEAESMYLALAARKPKDEAPQILLGDFYTESGERDKALAGYRRAVELNPESPAARDKLVMHYLDVGKLEEAAPMVKAIVDKDPKNPTSRFFDARLRLARGNPDEAIELLQQVLHDGGQSAVAHQYLGVAFAQKNDTAQARRELAEAVKLAPNQPDIRTSLAAVHLAEGSNDLAVEQAQAAIRLRPRNLQAIGILGDAYLRKGELGKAKQVFDAIVKAVPKDTFSHYRLGMIARAEKSPADAITHFENALAGNPNNIDALARIVAIKVEQGKQNEAVERVTRQIQSSPGNPLLHNLLGRVWMQAGNSGKAEEAFKQGAKADPALPLSYMNLAELYEQTGHLDEAIREYEAALKNNPKLASAHSLLGMIHERRQEYDKAKVHYQEALKLDPKFAPAANNLAWIYAERGGDVDAALSLARSAREQLPQDPSVADTLGWLYYKKNAYLRAIGFLKEAAEKMPDNPVVHYHLGMAYFKNGDTVSARKTLQQSLKLNKSFQGSEEAQQTLKTLKEI